MDRFQDTIIFLVGIVMGILLCSAAVKNHQPVSAEPVYELTTWVAHVSNNRSDMELVYTDIENDVAYYRYIGKRVTPIVGEIVSLYDGAEVKVTSLSSKGFTVESDNPTQFQTGMSNSPVYNAEGEIIGYMSTLLENNQCYCIWR